MATIPISDNVFKSLGHLAFTWGPFTTNGDVGDVVDYGPGAGGRSVQVEGTFGTGGNIIIEGSNDGTNWHTLNDLGGAALGTITAAGLYSIREEPAYIRPRLSAGTGAISLTVTLVVRKNNLG